MKRFFSILILGFSLFVLGFSQPAFAADLKKGAEVFSANCASCHAGGRNAVQANKNLKKATLEQYGMLSSEAIIAQVTKGKNAMPAFRGRLKPDQIENVAAYVLDQAEKDWKK